MSGRLTGFGGFGAVSMGALPPTVETGLQQALVPIDDLNSQIFADLSTLADQGVDISGYRAEAEAIMTEKSLIATEIAQIDETQVPAVRGRIDELQARGRALHARLLELRAGAPEGQQIMGLLWGLGAVAAAGAVAWFVWDRSRKRRR